MCKANKLNVESRRPFTQEKRSCARAIGVWGRAIRQGSNPTYTCVDDVHICALVHGNLTMHTRGPQQWSIVFERSYSIPPLGSPPLKSGLRLAVTCPLLSVVPHYTAYKTCAQRRIPHSLMLSGVRVV